MAEHDKELGHFVYASVLLHDGEHEKEKESGAAVQQSRLESFILQGLARACRTELCPLSSRAPSAFVLFRR